MRRHLAAIFVVLGALAAPAAAPAKEISKVSVCGATGQCTTYDKSDFKSLMFLADDAGPTDPPAASAPWYRLRFTVDEREHGGVNPRTAAVLKRAVRDLPAFSKARLRGLELEPLEVQAAEVFAPAADTGATRDRIDSRTTPWGWISGGVLVAALVLVMAAWTILRRRNFEATLP
jgi:hypothetical protein